MRAVSVVVLLLIICSVSVSVSKTQVAEAFAEGPIFIRSSGVVDPSDAPIQHVGDSYVLTGNITSSGNANGIVIERDNMVLDGARYTVQSDGNGTGIDLQARRNVTIKNTIVTGFGYGIAATQSSNISILENNVMYASGYGYSPGIFFHNCSNSKISGNIIENNRYGIWLYTGSNDSLIVENDIADNTWSGIMLDASFGNMIYHNNFVYNGAEMPKQVEIYNNSTSAWDDGYPLGGNWWNDWYGADSNGDGIFDSPRIFDEKNTDHYPLVNPWGSIYIKTNGSVDPISAPIQKNGDVYTLTNDIYHPIIVKRDDVTLDGAGHTIQGKKFITYSEGLVLTGRKNVTVENFNIKGFAHQGILLSNSTGNKILRNNMTGMMHYAYSNGVTLSDCYGNVISENNITNNAQGLGFYNSTGNLLCANNIAYNIGGIAIQRSSHNYVYHNNFVGNWASPQIYSAESTNYWYYGYPTEGNYWSDYTGTDANGDGIGEEPYVIDENNTDYYPLTGPLTVFDAGTWNNVPYGVTISSNSSLSGFQFDGNGAAITFTVSGPDGSIGICRVTIPKRLLWVSTPPQQQMLYASNDQWQVLVGGAPSAFMSDQDADNTYFSFNYTHSTKTVRIIGTNAVPEFSSFIILPLFMLVTLIAIALCRKEKLWMFRS